MREPRLYSYIVIHDGGFAPNPFFGYCTLACCKPGIRETAQPGDWIVGLSPKNHGFGNKVIYFMQVSEKLTFAEYWADPRFAEKKPVQKAGELCGRGDNIYEPKIANARRQSHYRQLPSAHFGKCEEDRAAKRRDLSSLFVLVAECFCYFGSQPVELPPELRPLIVARGHRCHFPPTILEAFREFSRQFRPGIYAGPTEWKDSNQAWEAAAHCSQQAGA